ncbi:hypothetical protein [Streptomyces sp. NPDC004065]|uniref:hypothetical protein n=1 Tax=Streptomyces sp. NPDC004065 TaxID=3364689 RepID=UPI00384E307A
MGSGSSGRVPPLESLIEQARTAAAAEERADALPSLVTGPGAQRVHAARALVRQLAAQPPGPVGIPATVGYAPVRRGDKVVHRPVFPRTPPLFATPEPSEARRHRQELHRTWQRLRRTEASMRTLLADGAASPHTRRAALSLATGLESAVLPESLTPASSVTGPPPVSVEESLAQRTANMLGVEPGASPLRFGPEIANVAIHDFAEYVYLREPAAAVTSPGGRPVPVDLQQFLTACHTALNDAVFAYGQAEIDVDQPGHYFTIDLRPLVAALVESLFKLFLAAAAAPLYEVALRLVPGYTGYTGSAAQDVVNAFAVWAHRLTWSYALNPNSVSSSFDDPAKWGTCAQDTLTLFFAAHPDARVTDRVGAQPGGYPFSLFAPGDVSFGLRLTYRQEWRPLGNQPGEIVRTIPLAPKQVEKVTTKIVTTRKAARTSETATSTETSTESSSTTRDSTDVVDEASSKFGWHVDAEASGGIGPVSAKLSAGASGEQASSSKQAKTSLNEAMSKTAGRMRRDTKIVISTESTTSSETSTTSEISNPNDEIAVTYVYSRLQRQYEIYTSLAEVASVVLVPETVPAWDEVDESWLRDHEWILRRVLLDPRLGEDLAEIALHPEASDLPDDRGAAQSAAEKAYETLGSFSAFPGYLPDVVGSSQEALKERLERQHEIAEARRRRKHKVDRLVQHVRANILHYMRAVWEAEDADQRLRRYAAVAVPTRWTFVPAGATDPLAPLGEVTGQFVPDLSPESLRPLNELVNPAGPIGFTANCAVFQLRAGPALVDLNDALTLLRSAYVRFAVSVTVASGDLEVRKAVAYEPRHESAQYDLTHDGTAWRAVDSGSGATVPVAAPVAHAADVQGIRLWLSRAPAAGDRLTVAVAVTDELEDPELRALGMSRLLPPDATAGDFFSPALLADMASYLPEVAAVAGTEGTRWADLDDEERAVVRREYHRYLLVRDHTRRFVLDTNNVVVDIDVGRTPVLEEFKRLHRAIDVLKELQESVRRRLENSRRQERLAGNDLSDPDIDSFVVVAADADVTPVVGPVIGGTTAAPAPPPS